MLPPLIALHSLFQSPQSQLSWETVKPAANASACRAMLVFHTRLAHALWDSDHHKKGRIDKRCNPPVLPALQSGVSLLPFTR